MLNIATAYILTSSTLYLAFTGLLPCRLTARQSIVCLFLSLVNTHMMLMGLRLCLLCVPAVIIICLCLLCRKQLAPLLVFCFSLTGYICYLLSQLMLTQLILWLSHMPVLAAARACPVLFCLSSLLITLATTYLPGRYLKKSFCCKESDPDFPPFIFPAVFCLSFLLLISEAFTLTTAGILCLSAILALFLLTVYIIQKEFFTQSMLGEYQSLKLYTDEMERLNLRFRAFRHDYIDILSTLSDYIESNDMDGLRCAFEQNIAPLGYDISSSLDRLGCLSHLKIPELKSIVSLKLLDAQNRGIRIFLDIEEDILSVPMDTTDLARILAIFFNNAIDELSSPDIINKVLEFGIIKKENSTLLILRNTTLADKSILSFLESPGYSSKGKGHGIGLTTVRTILAQYSNAVLSTSVEASVFIQALELYY